MISSAEAAWSRGSPGMIDMLMSLIPASRMTHLTPGREKLRPAAMRPGGGRVALGNRVPQRHDRPRGGRGSLDRKAAEPEIRAGKQGAIELARGGAVPVDDVGRHERERIDRVRRGLFGQVNGDRYFGQGSQRQIDRIAHTPCAGK